MRATYKLPCMVWLALLFLVHGDTTEAPDAFLGSEIESLDSTDKMPLSRDLILLDTGKSSGTSKLQMELEGMVDSAGNPVFMANASDVDVAAPPPVMSADDISAMSGNPADPDATAAAVNTFTGPPKYNQIPYLALKGQAKEHKGVTLSACQRLCDDETDHCRSFSYIADKKSCYVSAENLQYDLEFAFMVKHQPEQGGEPVFRDLGAMKFSAATMETSTAAPGLPKKKCQDDCATDVKCFSLAYRARDQLCIMSSTQMEYNSESTYYEKQGAAAAALKVQQTDAVTAQAAQIVTHTHGDGPAADAERRKAEDKEVKQKAALTPEQARFVAHSKGGNSALRAQQQVLQNALLGINTEVQAKNQAKVAAANKEAELAHKKALAREAAENLFKTTEKNTAKESRSKLQEAVESGQKDEEKAVEASAKAAVQSKERGAKQVTRLKHSKVCEKTQKNEEKADLKVAKFVTQKGDSCTTAGVARREQKTLKAQLNKATKEQIKWEDDLTTGTQSLVYLSEQREIKRTEKKISELETELDTVTQRYSEAGNAITKLKDALPAIDTAVASAQNDVVKYKAEKSAAELAVQSANAALLGPAKAQAAGAKSELAKAESALAAAQKQLQSKQDEISEKQVTYFQDGAKKQGLEKRIAAAQTELKNEKDKYHMDHNAASLKVSIAKHQLPRVKSRIIQVKKDIKKKEATVLSTDEKCTSDSFKLDVEKKLLQQYSDEQVVCTAERKEKVLAKRQADDDFESQKVTYRLKLAKKREADFSKAMADAELSMQTAGTLEERVAAGSKLADVRSSKMQADQEVMTLVPKLKSTEVSSAKSAAKETSAKAVVKQDTQVVEKDAALVKKGEAKEYKTDPKNPDVIIKNAKAVLEKLMHGVGLAEISAGEKDSTETDMEDEPKKATETEKTEENPKPDTTNDREIPAAEQLHKAAEAAQAGNGTEAVELIKNVEEEVVDGTATPPAQSETKPADSDAGPSPGEEAKAVVQQVKQTAEMNMLAQAKAKAEAALKAQEEVETKNKAKEAQTKAHIKAEEERILKLTQQREKEKQEAEERRRTMAGQWSFTGSAQDAVGTHGAANIKGATWATDDTYGKCLKFEGADSEADLGDLQFDVGTISIWLKVAEKSRMRLFGPGMEGPALSAVEAEANTQASVTAAMESSVKDTLASVGNALKSVNPLALLGLTEAVAGPVDGSGTVMIEEDGSVSIFDGNSHLGLAPKESLEVDQWYQLAFTFTKSSASLYINGALQHTVSLANGHDFSGHPFIIGRGLEGVVMNVDFWKRVLISAEVSKLPKPVSQHEKVKFVAHSAEGKYELAKTRAEDLMRREAQQRMKMKAAEKDVKKEEAEKHHSEIRDKSAMKAEKERRDELAVKDKAHEQNQKDALKERDSKERKTKSNEESEKDAAKGKEKQAKASRKEAMDKAEERQKEEEQRAAAERKEKADKREEDTKEAQTKEKSHKVQMKQQQETQAKENKSKEQNLKKAESTQERQEKAEAAATQERNQKSDQVRHAEGSNKESVQKSEVLAQQQRQAAAAQGAPINKR